VPANANKPYDIKELILKTVDEADFFEIQASFRQEYRLRLRADRRIDRRFCRQPADGAGRGARQRCVAQGGAVRALLRLLQHSDRHVRRCAGVSAGHGAGVRRA
jgi:hypothetical protein